MGKAWSGTPARQTGMASNFNPQVQSIFSQFAQRGPGSASPMSYDLLSNPLYNQATQAASQNIGQFDPTAYENLFQQGVANPSIRNYEQQVLPQLLNRYMDQSNLYGSGLNQALAQSSRELIGNLGEMRARNQIGAQESHQNRQLDWISKALGLSQAPIQNTQQYYNQLFGTQSHSPIVQGPQQGWLKDASQIGAQLVGALLGGGGNIGYNQPGFQGGGNMNYAQTPGSRMFNPGPNAY